MTVELIESGSLRQVFTTPVVVYAWPDSEALNRDLRALILDLEKESRGISRSNVGGWHSKNDFLGRKDPPVQALNGRIAEMLRAVNTATRTQKPLKQKLQLRLEGWANVVRRGHYHRPHNHPYCIWSGVYYVSAGEADESVELNGLLELLDPRAGANMLPSPSGLFDERVRIEPKPGTMVVFPSWMVHMVHPFQGAGERITVAFNLQAPAT